MLFCPNCGAENDDKARFCENCGAKIEKVEAVRTAKTVKKPAVNPAHIKKYKEKAKGLTKIQIVVIAEVICLILIIGIFFGAGSSRNSAESVAKRYFQAYSDRNWSKVYDMTDYPDGALLQKSQFIEAMKSLEVPEITSFEIEKGNQPDSGLEKHFTVQYTVKGEGADTLQLSLARQGEKSGLFFDTWKVSSYAQVAENFCINVPAGASAAVDGVALTEAEKGKSQADGMDSYYVTIFTGIHKIQTAAPWFELYNTDFSATQDGQFTVSGLKMTDVGQAAIQGKMQEALDKVYRAAMSGQEFSAVSELFPEKYKKAGEQSYNSFVSELRSQESYTLNQAVFTNFKCDIKYEPDGMLSAKMSFDYDTQYTRSYKSWLGIGAKEEETGKGSSYMTASFVYEGETYKLAAIDIRSVL
ncbi:MAG: zinc-ribbon domain-containing protein [Muricomes sp.]